MNNKKILLFSLNLDQFLNAGQELEARVREHVASGLYGSASEVIREALRLFEAHQSVQRARLEALKKDIDAGFDDVKAGRVSPVHMEEIKAEGRRIKNSY